MTSILPGLLGMWILSHGDPAPVFSVLFLPYFITLVASSLIPFVVTGSRKIIIDGIRGREYLLWYFGHTLFHIIPGSGLHRIYTTSQGICMGIWRTRCYRYSEIMSVRSGAGGLIPTINTFTIVLQSGKSYALGFGRIAAAKAFVRTLERYHVHTDPIQ